MAFKDEKLLSREEAADFLGVTKGTLEVWASTGRYELPVVKIGRLAKYQYSDLLNFISSRTLSDGRNELSFYKGGGNRDK